jgi:hypothetical protein
MQILRILTFYLLFSSLDSHALQCRSQGLSEFSDIKNILNKLTTQANENFKCPDWITKKENLPLCPKLKSNEKSTLPETYPKAFVFFGTEVEESYVIDILTKAYQSDPTKVPVFVGAIYSVDLKKVIVELKKTDKNFPWQNHLVPVSMVSQDSSVYVRDVFGSSVNSKGEISTFRTRSSVDGTVNGVFDLMERCGIKTFDPSDNLTEEEDDYGQYSLGGNFLTIIPGLNATSSIEPAHERVGWSEANTVIFEGSTNVGHIDEIAQPLKLTYDQLGCPKVSLLVASPSKSIELLSGAIQKNPDEYFLDWRWRQNPDGSFTEYDKDKWNVRSSQVLWDMHPASGGPIKGSGISPFCKRLETLPATNEVDFKKNEHYMIEFVYGKKRPRLIVLEDINKYPPTVVTLNLGWKEEDYKRVHDECKKFERCEISQIAVKPLSKRCENMTVKEAYQILKHTDFNSQKAKSLEESIIKFKGDVENKIKSLHPSCSNSIDWIESPVIYKDGYWALPNSTNSLPIDSKNVVLPEPYSLVFKDYFEQELKKRDLAISWVDTLDMNNQKSEGMKTGNIHCGSNSIPICKPRDK